MEYVIPLAFGLVDDRAKTLDAIANVALLDPGACSIEKIHLGRDGLGCDLKGVHFLMGEAGHGGQQLLDKMLDLPPQQGNSADCCVLLVGEGRDIAGKKL